MNWYRELPAAVERHPDRPPLGARVVAKVLCQMAAQAQHGYGAEIVYASPASIAWRTASLNGGTPFSVRWVKHCLDWLHERKLLERAYTGGRGVITRATRRGALRRFGRANGWVMGIAVRRHFGWKFPYQVRKKGLLTELEFLPPTGHTSSRTLRSVERVKPIDDDAREVHIAGVIAGKRVQAMARRE